MEYTVEEIRLELRNSKEDDLVQILIYNEDMEQDSIDIEDTALCDDGTILIDVSDKISEILVKHEQKIFQRCLDNTPKENQSEKTLEFITKLFGYEIKTKGVK